MANDLLPLLLSQLATQTEKIGEMRAQLAAGEREFNRLHDDVRELVTQLSKLTGEHQLIRREIADLDSTISELRGVLQGRTSVEDRTNISTTVHGTNQQNIGQQGGEASQNE